MKKKGEILEVIIKTPVCYCCLGRESMEREERGVRLLSLCRIEGEVEGGGVGPSLLSLRQLCATMLEICVSSPSFLARGNGADTRRFGSPGDHVPCASVVSRASSEKGCAWAGR